MKKFPRDINPTFEGSWEAYNELPGTRELKDVVRAEAFRILLKQAGVNQKTLKTASSFITVNKLYAQFIRRVKTSYLLNNFVPVKNIVELALNEDRQTNVVHGYSISGSVILKPQRFDLDYLLKRMYQVQIFKEFPAVLNSGKYATSRGAVRDAQYYTVWRDRDMLLRIARLKNDTLLFSYTLHFDDVVPLYPNLEKQIFAVWRRASLGDIQ